MGQGDERGAVATTFARSNTMAWSVKSNPQSFQQADHTPSLGSSSAVLPGVTRQENFITSFWGLMTLFENGRLSTSTPTLSSKSMPWGVG